MLPARLVRQLAPIHDGDELLADVLRAAHRAMLNEVVVAPAVRHVKYSDETYEMIISGVVYYNGRKHPIYAHHSAL